VRGRGDAQGTRGTFTGAAGGRVERLYSLSVQEGLNIPAKAVQAVVHFRAALAPTSSANLRTHAGREGMMPALQLQPEQGKTALYAKDVTDGKFIFPPIEALFLK